MLFLSRYSNLRLNTKEGAVEFERGTFETSDKKLQQAIKDTPAFKAQEVIIITEKELKQSNNSGE